MAWASSWLVEIPKGKRGRSRQGAAYSPSRREPPDRASSRRSRRLNVKTGTPSCCTLTRSPGYPSAWRFSYSARANAFAEPNNFVRVCVSKRNRGGSAKPSITSIRNSDTSLSRAAHHVAPCRLSRVGEKLSEIGSSGRCRRLSYGAEPIELRRDGSVCQTAMRSCETLHGLQAPAGCCDGSHAGRSGPGF